MAWSIARCVACALSISDWISGAYCGWPRRARGCVRPARFFDARSTWTPIEMKKATIASTIAAAAARRTRRARARRPGRRRSPAARRPAWRSLPARPCSARSPWTQVTRPKPGLTPFGGQHGQRRRGVAVREDHVGVVLQRLQVPGAEQVPGRARRAARGPRRARRRRPPCRPRHGRRRAWRSAPRAGSASRSARQRRRPAAARWRSSARRRARPGSAALQAGGDAVPAGRRGRV